MQVQIREAAFDRRLLHEMTDRVPALPWKDWACFELTNSELRVDQTDVTSLFRATCGVSLWRRERTQNERQAVYHGRQDSDLPSGGQWPSDLGCLSGTQPLGGPLPPVEAAVRANGD